MDASAADEAGAAQQQDPAGSTGVRDPPAITMQESYPRSDDAQDDEPDDNEPGSFIKMEGSQSEEDPQKMEVNTEEKHKIRKEEEADENEDEPGDELPLPTCGGKIDKKAFCLLDGIFEVRRLLHICVALYSYLFYISH